MKESQFKTYEQAKKENQTIRHKNKIYKTTKNNIIIYTIVCGMKVVDYKKTLNYENYKESQKIWEEYILNKINSFDEYLLEENNSHISFEELNEINKIWCILHEE